MTTLHTAAPDGPGGLRTLEPIMEVGLAVAAFAFTVVVWLLSSEGALHQQDQMGIHHVHLATVHVIAPAGRPPARRCRHLARACG